MRQWVGALVVLGVAGCNPSAVFINPEGLACSTPAEPCPGGWLCDARTQTCYSSDGGAPDAGPGTTAGTVSGTVSGTTAATTGASTGPSNGSTTAAGATSGGTSGTLGTGGSSSSTGGSTSGAVGCTIDGGMFIAGATEPTNGCASCQPAISLTTWTNLASGQACGGSNPPGNVCLNGACVSGCVIDGGLQPDGGLNPSDPCQICAPASSGNAWSDEPDGLGCDAGAGNFCKAGQCLAGCEIGGVFQPSNQLNPTNPCQACTPATSSTQWSTLADLTTCGTSAVCASGVCTDACVLDAGASSGVCGCASGVETCNGALADTCVDDANCGGCGSPCAVNSDTGCFNGQCGSPSAMPEAVDAASALLGIDGRFYVIGGQIGDTSSQPAMALNVVQTYDPRADRWGAAPNLSTARSEFAAAEDSQGNLYALGGVQSETNGYDPATATDLATGEMLQPGATAWTPVASAPKAFFAVEAGVGSDGLFYLPGGYIQGGTTAVTQTYDPVHDTWGTGPALRSALAAASVFSSQGTLSILGGGGVTGPLPAGQDVEQLASGGTWTEGAGLPVINCGFGSATDSAGNLYLLGGGGCNLPSPPSAYIQVCSPAAHCSVSSISLIQSVSWPACALGADGRIFCFGGFSGGGATNYVQVFNPKTQAIVSSP